jgi:hypothetical protein
MFVRSKSVLFRVGHNCGSDGGFRICNRG